MKNTAKLFTGISILLMIFMPIDSISQIRQHHIGYGHHYGGELDTCRYWIVGDKNKVVFHELYHLKYAYMNIDNKEVKLFLFDRKEIKRNGKRIGYRDKYKSTNFQVDTNFMGISTTIDKRYGSKTRGKLIIKDNNSWQKTLPVECIAYPD
jgi:hypothetical protein